MGRQRLIIGTRNSPLARAQTALVIQQLQVHFPLTELELEVVPITTEGDRSQGAGTPLQQLAGQGVFVKELERALLEGSIDIAVHSLKDMTAAAAPGLALAAIPPREDPRDVLISRDGATLVRLAQGARIGSSSQRRAAQLAQLRPDLRFESIRGNVDTRLRKVELGEYDAIVLAAAGLLRLGVQDKITEYFPPEVCLPDPGQGALAVQVRAADQRVCSLIAPLDHLPTRAAVTAERAFLEALGGGCAVPMGALATQDGDTLLLQGMVASPDGRELLRAVVAGPSGKPEALGAALAEKLMNLGAARILAQEGSAIRG